MIRPTFAAALLLLASAALAQSDLRVIQGMRFYGEGEFAKARDVLVTAVESPALSRTQRVRARIYLAASYYALNDMASAKGQFLALARSDPDTKIDPVMFVPELVALFDDAKEEVARETPAEPPRPAAPPVEKKVELVPAPAPAPGPPLALAFVPFGVGQFANGDGGRGWIYLGAEAAAYAVATGGLFYFESLKREGTFLGGGSFEDPAQARAIQNVYLAGFWAGNALAAIGIADAVLTRRPAPPPVKIAVAPSGAAVEVRF